MPEAPAPLAVVTDYASLIAALRKRVVDMEVSFGKLERVAGLSDGYLNKALRGMRTIGPATMGPTLGALSLKLVVVHDPEQFDRMRHRLPRRSPTGRRIADPEMPLGSRERWEPRVTRLR